MMASPHQDQGHGRAPPSPPGFQYQVSYLPPSHTVGATGWFPRGGAIEDRKDIGGCSFAPSLLTIAGILGTFRSEASRPRGGWRRLPFCSSTGSLTTKGKGIRSPPLPFLDMPRPRGWMDGMDGGPGGELPTLTASRGGCPPV